MTRLTLAIPFIALLGTSTFAQQNGTCSITNRAFGAGEQVCYEVSYTWFLIWTDVGEACFSVDADNRFGKTLLHLKATGKSYFFYDWFFKVRDLYESWVDPVTLTPYYFNRNIYEGGFTKENEYWFGQPNRSVKIRVRRRGGPNRYVSLKVTPCTFDVVTAIYFTRCLDFSSAKSGAAYPVTVLMDEEIYAVKYRYLGKGNVKLSGFGSIACLKFQIDVVAGDIFSQGQKIYVWVTDDINKLPVYIESPIRVGSIRARIKNFSGLKKTLQLK